MEEQMTEKKTITLPYEEFLEYEEYKKAFEGSKIVVTTYYTMGIPNYRLVSLDETLQVRAIKTLVENVERIGKKNSELIHALSLSREEITKYKARNFWQRLFNKQ